MQGPASEQPVDDDVVIWHLPDRDGLDVYRVTKGSRVIGEFTGRSVGPVVLQAAIEQAEPGRAVWLMNVGFVASPPTIPSWITFHGSVDSYAARSDRQLPPMGLS